MKTKYLIVLMLGLLVNACDIIEEPYMKPVDNDNNNGEVVQKILLEEFTGHQCPNCPVGAQTASQLHDYYGDRFIIIAYHAGWFARTSPGFTTDYRTAIGEEFNSHFQVNAYPRGMINRKPISSSTLLDPTEWGTAAESIIDNEPRVCFTVSKMLILETRTLSVSILVKALTEVSAINVCVFVTESNLVSPQKVVSSSTYPDGIIPNYVHNHVFRTSLNGAWGTSVFSSGAAANQSQNISVNGVLGVDWIIENLSLVCFAYDSSTGEIIQAEEIAIQ